MQQEEHQPYSDQEAISTKVLLKVSVKAELHLRKSHLHRMTQSLTRQVFAHLDGIHRRSEDGVVVLDAPPESGPGGTGQVTAILLQDTQGLDQSTQ